MLELLISFVFSIIALLLVVSTTSSSSSSPSMNKIEIKFLLDLWIDINYAPIVGMLENFTRARERKTPLLYNSLLRLIELNLFIPLKLRN
ncbi:hypothetical protein BpHYR1_044556 [Brachionus plicatilis]|uniref:Uncharacterized protein n=1 Tax=Brachionus plicatilis TaxID=10195 RepID=A0A3M7R136_BRAPC|nr:hypothetical protein BpHYR1_044556 [Brachionus plicatilis]